MSTSLALPEPDASRSRPQYVRLSLEALGVRTRRELGVHWAAGHHQGAEVCCCGLVLDAPLAEAAGHRARSGCGVDTAFVAEWHWQRYVALCQRCGWQAEAVREAEEAHWLVARHSGRCSDGWPRPGDVPTGSGPLRAGDPGWVGPWRLYRRLASGGTSTAYLAQAGAGRPPVVVKVLRDADEPEAVARFRREARVLRRLTVPVVPRLLASDVDAEPPWLALELLTGGTVEDAVRSRGPMAGVAWWALAGDLLRALAALHDLGVVHRDVKPANAVLDPRGARLVDLGAAVTTTSTRVTAAGSVVGTPGWMSPEQVQGRRVTAASDLFSLGALLAYAGTGRPPFGTGTLAEVAVRVAATEPRLAGLVGAQAQLVSQLLAKDPLQRPTARGALHGWRCDLPARDLGGAG